VSSQEGIDMLEPATIRQSRERFEHSYAPKATDDVTELLEQRFATFQGLISTVENMSNHGKIHEAAAYAQIAATYAMNRHPGLFVSPRLERALANIGHHLKVRCSTARTASRNIEQLNHVLHVFTLTSGIGGHTRMVWRWLAQDPGRRHSVVITRQGARKIPRQLEDAVERTGGQVHALDRGVGDLLTWAASLRRLAMTADLVVLHTNPNDVIPTIALSDKANLPSVVFLNHADHVFWLGASVSDVVANQRMSGLVLSENRRGIEPEKNGLLPIVVDWAQRRLTHDEAKRSLGLPEDSVVLLSVARPHKYAQVDATRTRSRSLAFPDVFIPVLKKYPQALLLVVGPDHDSRWENAYRETNGRIRALGVRKETDPYYQAADIYLDSFPVTSITSLLEAGSLGIPLVSCFPYSSEAGVLGSDTPGIDRHLIRVTSADEYEERLSQLIEDADYRRRIGSALQDDIKSVHSGEGWRSAMDGIYRQATNVQHGTSIDEGTDEFHITELDRFVCSVFVEEPGLNAITRNHLRLLPFGSRIRLWWNDSIKHRRFLPGLLLPEWMGNYYERFRHPHGTEIVPMSVQEGAASRSR
jgi:hypothetical protein